MPPSSSTTRATAASTDSVLLTSAPTPMRLGAALQRQPAGRVRGGGLVEVDDRDRGALLGEPGGAPEADALGGPGDHCDSSVVSTHGAPA